MEGQRDIINFCERPRVFTDWYLVQCKPRQDYRAAKNIRNQGGEVLLFERPIEAIRAAKRFVTRERLFPGYVFVCLPYEHRLWSTLRSTYGVSRVVRFGDKPLEIQPQTLEAIYEQSRTFGVQERFQAGDRVRLTSGAFKGMEAVFDAYDGATRAVLLIQFLQKEQRIKVPLNSFS
ncbi:MAG: transcription termination/antitermination NusG family protein [Gammaproteobacteria bacterium]